jgi:hypothetical protein
MTNTRKPATTSTSTRTKKFAKPVITRRTPIWKLPNEQILMITSEQIARLTERQLEVYNERLCQILQELHHPQILQISSEQIIRFNPEQLDAYNERLRQITPKQVTELRPELLKVYVKRMTPVYLQMIERRIACGVPVISDENLAYWSPNGYPQLGSGELKYTVGGNTYRPLFQFPELRELLPPLYLKEGSLTTIVIDEELIITINRTVFFITGKNPWNDIMSLRAILWWLKPNAELRATWPSGTRRAPSQALGLESDKVRLLAIAIGDFPDN